MAEEREVEPVSSVIAEDRFFVEETTPAVIPQKQELQEEELQEQNMENETSQEKTRIRKKRQKRRRAITYLAQISKQVERNGNQIDRITTFIQSLQKQRQSIISAGVGIRQSQSRSIKQIKSQLGQLQKQVSLIQKDIQKLRASSAGKARFRKLNSSSSATIAAKPKSRMSKKNKAIVSTRLRRRRIKKR
jgi:hypothetical protein